VASFFAVPLLLHVTRVLKRFGAKAFPNTDDSMWLSDSEGAIHDQRKLVREFAALSFGGRISRGLPLAAAL
jgi:hypothetical protein